MGCPSPQELMILPSVIRTLHNEFPAMHPIIKSAPLPVLQNHLEDHSIDVLLCYKEKTAGVSWELIRSSPEHLLSVLCHPTIRLHPERTSLLTI